MINRRDALKSLSAMAGAAGLSRLLAACGAGDGRPDGISTVVLLMLENRSYDHLLGARSMLEGKPGEGPVMTATNPDLAGNPIGLWPATMDRECVIDPPHDWDSSRAQLNGGACDGFVKAHQSAHGSSTATEPMQYLTRDLVPVTYALADAYATCDLWHASVLGPTWPNRMYWHTGQSHGIKANDFPSSGLSWPSIYHRLEAKQIDWAYYYGSVPVVSVITDLDLTNKVFRFSQFFKDAAAGTLPPVVYIDPAFFVNDDHPPMHPINGQELIGSIYTALAASPQWKNCLFIVTYDEHGGFYDHLAPGKTADDDAAAGFDQLGFRVPALVVGPYVKAGHVSSVSYDHTSALKHLETMFKLDPLTMRSTAASDLMDCIDLPRLAKAQWSPPVTIPAVDVAAWPMVPLCFQTSGKAAPPHPILAWADANRDRLGALDLRGEEAEYLTAIRRQLDAAAARGLIA
jgi:phospholipase C